MTGPIKFNPFQGVGGTKSVEDVDDRRKTLRFPDIDLSPVELKMNLGQDDDGMVNIDDFDFAMNKKVPK